MKAILEYSLPEETEEYTYAMNGMRYSIVLEDLDNWLRAKYKYEDQTTISIEEVRSKIHELKEDLP